MSPSKSGTRSAQAPGKTGSSADSPEARREKIQKVVNELLVSIDSEFAADFEYQPYVPGMRRRYTICRLFEKDLFNTWRQQQVGLRGIIAEHNKNHIQDPISIKDVRLRKPKPVAAGFAVCDMVTPNWGVDDRGRHKDLPPDTFSRLEGKKFALLDAMDTLKTATKTENRQVIKQQEKARLVDFYQKREAKRAARRDVRLRGRDPQAVRKEAEAKAAADAEKKAAKKASKKKVKSV